MGAPQPHTRAVGVIDGLLEPNSRIGIDENRRALDRGSRFLGAASTGTLLARRIRHPSMQGTGRLGFMRVGEQRSEAGKSVILIDHNILRVYSVADRFVVLDRGRVAGQFAKSEISRDQLVEVMVELHQTGQVLVS